MRWALGLEYDGAVFCGWQTQPSACAVQDHLELALAQIAGESVESVCAGRTDAGVHAWAQVVHFDTRRERPESAWVRGVNAHLPPALRVTWARQVSDDFHARYAALSRTYAYWLLDQPVAPAIGRQHLGWFHQRLDVTAMQRAAQLLVGVHDFSAFRAADCQAKHPVRTLFIASVSREGDLVRFHFTANAFLHHMVRNIVGALVYVGAARQPVEWLAQLLAARDRSLAAPTFEPNGLYLAGVRYPDRFGLPQAAASRDAPAPMR